jgi:hypothetical protein
MGVNEASPAAQRVGQSIDRTAVMVIIRVIENTPPQRPQCLAACSLFFTQPKVNPSNQATPKIKLGHQGSKLAGINGRLRTKKEPSDLSNQRLFKHLSLI